MKNFKVIFFNKNLGMSQQYAAFTLAEVLITLGVIGIVAAMTIPTLMNNINDAQYKTAYKKAYRDLSTAWIQMSANNEVVSCSGSYDATCSYDNFEVLKNYIKVEKNCITGAGHVADCWNMNGEKYNNAVPDGWEGAFVDSSGRSWVVVYGAYADGIQILVDTNGFSGPNKFGKDRFVFEPSDSITATGLWPRTANKVAVLPDRNSNIADCPKGATSPCYGTSWLYN